MIKIVTGSPTCYHSSVPNVGDTRAGTRHRPRPRLLNR
jgi:hypothetical protein